MSINERSRRVAADTLVLTVIMTIFTSSHAFAYIDPGSGSVIVTTILGIFAAIGYTFRKYFYKIRRKVFGYSEELSQDERDR